MPFSLLDEAKSLVSSTTEKVTSTAYSKATSLLDFGPLKDLTSGIPFLNSGKDLSDFAGRSGTGLAPSTDERQPEPIPIAADNDYVERVSGFNQYDIIYYPTELLDAKKRYPHAMGIFINANSKSKLGKKIDTEAEYSIDMRLDGDWLDASQNSGNQGVGSQLNKKEEGTVKEGSFEGFLKEQNMGIARFKRFTGCILLPLPQDISASYSAEYNSAAIDGAVGAGLSALAGSQTKEMLANMKTGAAQSVARESAKSLTVGLSNVLGNLKGGAVMGVPINLGNASEESVAGLFDKVTGNVLNPRTEQVFSKMETRTWNWSWQISIQTQKEWNSIRKIIAMLKENMHPELDAQTGGVYMAVPNEFDIEFYETVGESFKESTTLPKVGTCALTSLEINYTPHGQWIAYNGTMIPPFVSIRASFKEMEPLHRDMVRDVVSEKKKDYYSATPGDDFDSRRGF